MKLFQRTLKQFLHKKISKFSDILAKFACFGAFSTAMAHKHLDLAKIGENWQNFRQNLSERMQKIFYVLVISKFDLDIINY